MGDNRVRRKNSQLLVGLTVLAALAFGAGTTEAAVLNSCTTYCHGMPPRDSLRKANPHFNSQSSAFLGNHRNHLSATAAAPDCGICHAPVSPADFSHQNEIIAMANSIKGYSSANIRAKYDKGTFFNQTSIPNLTNATCSNVSCHFETKTPAWGSTAYAASADCSSCHGFPPAGTSGAPSGGLAGSHARHDAYFPGTAGCQKCHPGYSGFTHATSAGRPLRVQGYLRSPLNTLESGAAYSGSGSNYLPSQSSSQIFGSCSNLYCHGASMPGGDSSGSNKTPLWNSSSYLPATLTAAACGTCHGFPPLAASGHPEGVIIPAGFPATPIGGTCSCHSNINTSTAAASSYANIFVSRSLHINGVFEPAASGHAFPYGGATHKALANPGAPYTNCNGCHDATTAGGTYPVTAGTAPFCSACHLKTANFNSAAPGCWDCHGSTATNGQPNGNVFPNISGSHTKHVVGQGMACSACHSNGGSGSANHGSSNRVASGSAFVNLTSTTAQFHFTRTGKGNCSNIACHGPAEWGVTKFNCLTCHSVAIGARAAVTGQFASQSHHVQGAELPLTTAHCAKCHWEAKADGSIDSVYHSGTSNKGVSLIVWNGTTRPVTATMGTTYISYTANGSRDQIAKLNQVCLGCHNSAGIPAGNIFGTFATDNYSPEAKLLVPKARTSILSRYSSTRTVAWSLSKYSSAAGNVSRFGTNNKYSVSKALSAHGNAVNNDFPVWSATTGDDGHMADSAPANLGKNRNVLCYDCHNSHGSDAAGITSSYSSATGRYKGGLLKSTVAGQGGYAVTYKPGSRSIIYRNVSGLGQAAVTTTTAVFNSGAGICNDCHNNDTRKVNISKPWSITGTYSSTRAIVGYWSTPYFDNYTFNSAKRTAYKLGGTVDSNKDRRKPMGGHYGSSVSSRSAGHSGQINGLCTPCHDPHGVSNALGADRGHGVPLLKGSWVTSPYREDKADRLVIKGGGRNVGNFGLKGAVPGYHIDQNTFMIIPAPRSGGAGTATTRSNLRSQRFRSFSNLSSAMTATGYPNTQAASFAGLCLECHNQASLTNNSAPSAGNWKTPARIHQSVAGWAATTGSNSGNKIHAYTCAKCHAPHVSRLPRLLVTNCLDQRHFGQSLATTISSTANVTVNAGNIIQSTLAVNSAYGAGRFPGGGSRYSGTPSSAQNPGGWWFQTNGAAGNTQPSGTPNLTGTTNATTFYGSACHNATNAGGATYSPLNQMWNRKSTW